MLWCQQEGDGPGAKPYKQLTLWVLQLLLAIDVCQQRYEHRHRGGNLLGIQVSYAMVFLLHLVRERYPGAQTY
jgi:hypothetical protein